MVRVVLGVDIGTSSSKAVLVSFEGKVLAKTIRMHRVSRPHSGWAEMSGTVWWEEFASMSRELLSGGDYDVVAVGVSGMGPCVLVATDSGYPLRPAILYGIDSRASAQIERLTTQLGAENIVQRCGSALSTQSVGPKLAWIDENEPRIAEQSRRLFMPASWLVWNLTGEYVLDHHSASQCTPLYDIDAECWYQPWVSLISPRLHMPKLVWPGEVVGTVGLHAALETGLPEGTPVIGGTIDAWMESVSVGAQEPGDLMLMYGTTMFLINTLDERISAPGLWGTVGVVPDTRNLAGGMATSGAITDWLRELFGSPSYEQLLAEAGDSRVGARGLVMLPYFAGERTPIADPKARGLIAGLTIEHTRGDLYRAALEATAMGVRHNIEAIQLAGGRIERTVAVGGGTQGNLWAQIVSDVTGMNQQIPTVTVGASFGGAYLAARCVESVSINEWNPIDRVVTPDLSSRLEYSDLYVIYRALYPATAALTHTLANRQSERPQDRDTTARSTQ